MIEKIYIDWEDFGIAIDELVEEINSSVYPMYDGVYGFPRGGLPVAVALSHKLRIPFINNIDDVTDDTLIVDDINDTGKTLKNISIFNDIATIYSAPWSIVNPTFFVRYKVLKESWIIFPWENWNTEGELNTEENDMEEIQTTIPDFE